MHFSLTIYLNEQWNIIVLSVFFKSSKPTYLVIPFNNWLEV